MEGGGSAGRADSVLLERVLGHHQVAAVLLRDGELHRANEPARQAVVDPDDHGYDVDELDARLRRALVVEGRVDDLAPGETRSVMVELATNRVLLRCASLASAVDDDGTSVLVTFSTGATETTDPAHVARLETMLEATSDIIAVLDGDGRLRFANAAGRRITGLTGHEVNGSSIADLVHPDDVDEVTELFLRAVSGEKIPTIECHLRRADGSYQPVEAEVAAEVTVDEAPAYVVTVRDISERIRRQAEQRSARRYLEALVENLADVIVVLGEDLSVQWASPGIEQLIDAPAYTNVGENAFNDMHPDDIGGVGETLAALLHSPGATDRVEFRLNHQRRGWRWVEAGIVNRLEDPDIQGLVCTLRDITEQRDLDAELRRLHEQDRLEVARLREADRLKDQFLATVSHELRTPLASVSGFSEVLQRRAPQLDEAARADMVERIHANACEMEQMVDQLLELSRLQAGRVALDLERISLEDTVRVLLDKLDHQLSGHQVVTRLQGLHVQADQRALDNVLRNLLTNAARYSEPGTTIEVEAEHREEGVVVHVRDQGIGISEDDQIRIFQSFYQVDSASSGHRGTGIGLNIARRYAQLLSGRLRVESKLGEGSTFSLTLPAAELADPVVTEPGAS